MLNSHVRTHFCTRVQHAYTYAWSVIRAYSPQGRAMLHRELHYVYTHSSHCVPFSRTLSFYLSLGPSLSLSLSFFLHRVRSFLSSNLLLTLIFLYHSSYAILCISGAMLIFFATSPRFYYSLICVNLLVLSIFLHPSKVYIYSMIVINK